jgi:hypothetical protein
MYDRQLSTRFGGKDYHREIYDHEMLHAVSGRSIRRISLDQMNQPALFQSMRIGVTFSNAFDWLNEAITESLTQDILIGKRDLHKGSYETARKIYHNLLSRIPEELFLNAFFENSQDGSDDSRPHWDALIAFVEKEFGRDILTELDDHIEREGNIEAGVKILRNIL